MAFSPVKVQVVNHLFKVEGSNVVAPEVNYDLICISFPLVIRNNNVLIQYAYSGRWILRSQHSYAEVIQAGLDYSPMAPVQVAGWQIIYIYEYRQIYTRRLFYKNVMHIIEFI